MFNPFLILTHFFVCVFTLCLLSIIVLYLKEKATHKSSVKDQIQTDIGILDGMFVFNFSIATIIRELHGPLHSKIFVEVIFYNQVSISSTFYEHLLRAQIPKAQKRLTT